MKSFGTFLALAFVAAHAVAGCGSGDDAPPSAAGTGGTGSEANGELAGEGGAIPDITPFCAEICRKMAAVDCSSGTAVPVEGDHDLPVDDPYCLEELCQGNVAGLDDPTIQKSCQREWTAFVECEARAPVEDFGCNTISGYHFHGPIVPYLCEYPEIEDYNLCSNTGGSQPYQPTE